MAHLREEVPHTKQDRAMCADLAGRNPAGQEQQHDNAETQRDKTYHEYHQSIEGISHLYHLIPDYIFTGGCSHTASFVLALRHYRSSSIAMLLLMLVRLRSLTLYSSSLDTLQRSNRFHSKVNSYERLPLIFLLFNSRQLRSEAT